MSEDAPRDKDLSLAPLTSQIPSSNSVTQVLNGTTDPRSIGNYRLLKKLGEGGMGQVWLAEQTAPVRRQVALKLIRSGMCDDTMLQRFQSERQSLAIMDHSSIAKVFDAGAAPDGQPYFVMEYVPGLPITEYCDQGRLNIRERLTLFVRVCEGVQHAHQKSIMHRDLKPANVLVVEVDGQPTPRIIDFGLAKASTLYASAESTVTLAGAPLGTPAYMSPEQADPSVRDVDTRTDVYSLGVLLYELLTGALPLDPEEWADKPLDYVLRQVREKDTPRPSTQFKKKATANRNAATAAADLRRLNVRELGNLLGGDLDWIVMKALEKDRSRRYGTPGELSTDIVRHLNHEAVMAGPATTAYRIRKYALRHRIALGVAAVVLLMLAGFVVTQAIELRRITRERDRATRITDFMTGIFKVSSPSEARANSVTAREILDKASTDIDTGLTKDPELQAQMMSVMGDVYDNLGFYSRAQALQQKAVEIRQRVFGPESPETLKSMSAVALTLHQQTHFAEAETLLRQTLDTQTRVLGPEHPDTLASMNNLAKALYGEGRRAEAEKLDRQTLEVRRRVLGSEHPDTLASMDSLATVLISEDRYAEAEKLDRETLDVRRRVLGADHLDTVQSISNLSNALSLEGNYVEAEKMKRETLDIRRRVLGPEHPDTLISMLDLSETLIGMGEYIEAEKELRQALDIQRRVLGPEHPMTALLTYNLACLAARQGRQDQALSLLREAVDHGLPPNADSFMERDNDLTSLHGNPRFTALIAHAKERAAAARGTN